MASFFPAASVPPKNLCDFAVKGENCDMHPEVQRLISEFAAKQKPQAVLCIAPAMMAKAYQGAETHPTLTIGNDQDTSTKIEAMGSTHQDCAVQDVVVDATHKIVSTPAYMLGQNISEVAEGIEKAVDELVKMLSP